MTITAQTASVTVLPNGAQTVFDYGFLIPTRDTARLTLINTDTNAVVLVPPSQWGITGVGAAEGGTFTYPLAGDPVGPPFALKLERRVPYTQPTNLSNQGAYYPRVVEAALDWIVMQVQQISTAFIESAGLFANLPPVEQRRNRLLAFDSEGNVIAIDPADVFGGESGDYVLLTTEDGTAVAIDQTLLDAILDAIGDPFASTSAYTRDTLLPLADRAAWQNELEITPSAPTLADALAHVLAEGGEFAGKVTLTPSEQTADEDAATRGFVLAEVAAVSAGAIAYLHVQHERAAGVSGGTAAAGAWNPVPLNTTKATAAAIGSASHDTGAFTISLPAGTYRARAWQEFHQIDGASQIRLRDITNNVTVAVGGINRSQGDRGQRPSILEGTFILAGTATLRLEYRVGATRSGDGLGAGGASGGWGESNPFGSLLVERLA